VGYGVTLALLYLEGPVVFHSLRLFGYFEREGVSAVVPFWVGELILGLLLVAVVARLFARSGHSWGRRSVVIALLATMLIAGVSMNMPGLSIGFIVVLLGFSSGNRVLVGLGIAALLFYASAYYYSLHATLLVKSGMLAATGVVLLSARWALLKWVPPLKESSHA
jgi:uncharacterized membrane protein